MNQASAIPVVNQTVTLKEALIEMTQKKLGMTAIVNHTNALIGVFTDGDIRRTLDQQYDIHTTPIMDVMSPYPKTLTSDALAYDALALMEQYKITSLVVVNTAQQPIGVIHIHDILRAGIS
jgi:arabinose-5-phosphate isomerase